MLDERARTLLKTLVERYIAEGQPVGSRTLSRASGLELSPATIRNVMADLEDAGYLTHPHTSAGRVPTDKAYRFYVDHLERVPWIAGSDAVGREAPSAHVDAAEQVMADAPLRLSQRTHMTGLLLTPPLHHTALSRIELLRLSDDRALAVIVTETGWVTARPIALTARLSAEELRELGRALARRYRGQTFGQILEDVANPADPLDPLWTRSRALVDQVVALFRERTLYLSGATHILDHPDLSDVATMRTLLHAFEDKARLIDLLSQMAGERGVQVMIGSENPLEDMRGCSIIASTYTYRDQALGVLGVVGPRRMAYSDVISLVDETARLVSYSLSRVTQQLYLPS